MAETTAILVEVVYALPDGCATVTVSLKTGATVADAIKLSGLAELHPQIRQTPLVAGIFGRRIPLSAEPQSGDRIEIYRPLVADPKQLRLTRARSPGKAVR